MKKKISRDHTYLICITGASGSGKSTILSNLIKLANLSDIKDYVVINIDSYYKSRDDLSKEERANLNFDHPASIDFDLLKKHLNILIFERTAIPQPIYDFSEHVRKKETELKKPATLIFLEGIFALEDAEIIKLADLKIFVDTDSDLCIIRRIERDMSERERTLSSIIEQYTKFTKPMFEQFILPTKKRADIIIPEGGYNNIAIEVLLHAFKNILSNIRKEKETKN